MLKVLNENRHGKDYFVGDIHGCYDLLMQTLDTLGFNPTRDRLISVGDLVDRGPDSRKCLELVKAPWFHAVRGNHEQMMIDWHRAPGAARSSCRPEGGEWFARCPRAVQTELVKLAAALPIFLQIQLGSRRIGVIHGDFLEAAWITPTRLDRMAPAARHQLRQTALWGRSRIGRGKTWAVEGIDLIVCGHTVVADVSVLGNVAYIDTGACFSGRMEVLRGDQLFGTNDINKERLLTFQ